MKKTIFIFSLLLVSAMTVFAQATLPPASSANGNPNAPIVELAETLYDFGTIAQDSDGTHNFIYKNIGKEPLILSNVRSSCGCTVPEWSKEPLFSRQQDTIKVKYDTHRLGRFNKTISIFSNASKPMVMVRIQGEVIIKP